MNPLTLALAILGLTGFALGAVLTATGPFEMGVILMGMGLVFQVISLVQIKRAKQQANAEGRSNARGRF
jgi:Zn-dependent membrane protease YugP